MKRKITVLVSNSQLDVMATQANGFWEHSRNGRDIELGDLVYIKPNQQELKKYNKNAKVLKGQVSKVDFDVVGQGTWPSGHTMSKGMRVELTNMSLIDFDHVEDIIGDLGQNASSIYYLEMTWGKND